MIKKSSENRQYFWYCRTCVLPSTRPNLIVNRDGSCECVAIGRRSDEKREILKQRFQQIVSSVRKLNREYDCVIPVSGGKDSTWQVFTALEYGLRPICVTWKSPARSELGQKNLLNLISLGVDHIDFTINPDVERRFTKEAFTKVGSPAIPMHMAIHALALNTALRYGVPLVIYGENSADEYGSSTDSSRGYQMRRDWLMKYGGTQGTIATDWISETLSERELSPYLWPSDEQLDQLSLKAIFLGYFFPWDPIDTYQIASSNGFEAAAQPTTGIYNFADIDDSFVIAIHHFMKWPKFGFTRSWDNISIEIRHGRMTREQGIAAIRDLGDESPHQAIRDFCHYVKMTEDEFWEVVNRFRNPKVWERRGNSRWQIRNFLIDQWLWDER